MAVTSRDRQYAKLYARQHAIYERKIVPLFYAAIKASIQPVLNSLNPNDVKQNVWLEPYKQAYKLATPFAAREYRWLKQFKADSPIAFFNEIWRQAMEQYGLQVNLEFSKDLTDTTKEQIIRSIAEANAQLLSRTQTARLIEQYTLGEIGRNRSLLIARTEATTASNKAKQLGAESYFKELGQTNWYKMWVTRVDGRERPDHLHADGEIVASNEKFEVGGFAMDIPGDPKAPAKERVRCRCTTVNLSERQYQRRLGNIK